MHDSSVKRALQKVVIFLIGKQKWVIAVALLIGLIGRVGIALREHPETSMQHMDDGIEYLAQAKSILNGRLDGHPTLFQFIRSPGYSLFLLPFEWLTPIEGREWTPSRKLNFDPPVRVSTRMFRMIQLVQCLLSLGSAVIVGRITRRMAGPVAGIVAITLMSLNPFVMVLPALILSETVFLFLLWLSVHELMRFADNPDSSRWRTMASASITLAAGCLCRPNLMATLPACAFWVGWIEWRRSGRGFPALLAMTEITVVISAFLLPLMIRNKVIHGELNLSPFYATAVLAQGHSPHYLAVLSATNKAEYSQHLNQLFLQSRSDSPVARTAWMDEPRRFFRESRTQWWRLQWLKTIAYWRPWLNPTVFTPFEVVVSAVAIIPLYVGGFCSLLISKIRREPLYPLLWSIALTSYLIGGFLFTASTRFRIPFMDVSFMIMTGATIAVLLERFSGIPQPRIAENPIPPQSVLKPIDPQ